MPYPRLRRMVQGQGGSTLIELLVAMPIAMVLLAAVIQSLGTAGRDQQDIERRTEALTNGQIGLERMTREFRQATWLYFRSSSVVDLNVRVRAAASSHGVYRLVRYDCSGDTCQRSEGAPVAYPPPSTPSFSTTSTAIGDPSGTVGNLNGQVVSHDIFFPSHIDPATGVDSPNFLKPDFVRVRLQIAFADRPQSTRRSVDKPIVLEDGVSLRNATTFAG
jgi:type II secretory pathway pseudopilin PulG